MNKYLILFLVFFFVLWPKSKQESTIIPVQIAVVRFDKIFFETPPDQLHKIKKEFRFFFFSRNDDAVWIERCKIHCGGNFMMRFKKYANVATLKQTLSHF
jgi:hypothetical protein